MAQVGRISGPLLEANLLRQGIANDTLQNLSFKNTDGDTSLLRIDVVNGRIGVDLEAPANELHVSQTTQTTDLIVTNCADIANFNICNTDINVNSGDLYLNAQEAIVLSNLETPQFYVSDNYISTHSTNTGIDLKFNGTGILDVRSNLEVFGSLHAGGNVTFDGNVTFGDQATDTVDFNADVRDDIIPDIDDAYTLGDVQARWNKLYTGLVNGQLVTSGAVNMGNIFLDMRQGGIFYVAKNGSDTNVGDHPNGPLATIKEALSRCDASTDGPVTVLVYPGVYEETCPLVVPDRVTIRGVDLRNTAVKPTVATQDKDIFHLGDSCTISDITIKDYYYDSVNNTGYAFRFTPNAVITNRSPYVQNVTVITQGSVTSSDDPRGFDEGDAGRGAWIDGAELNSASIEASMLFHSSTFICPNADVINMTNGVRVEWLNSFTYFANRGLYAFNGVTGRTTYDGSTVEYGAELRSIGSANVYGNYGAVADGADTLMYLIQHNMAYIGAGKYVDNDKSRAIYANEVEELNSGKIHFTTTDHLGGFRIGDNFWVDFETGNTTINIDTLSVNQFNALRVNTGPNTTVIDGAYIDVGNFTVSSNVIESRTGDVNIASASGQINLQNNTNINGTLDISGNLTFDGTLNFYGDQATDRLEFNTSFEQDFNPHQHLTFDLGSFEKRWLIAHLDRVEANDFSIYDNVIEVNVSNADFELRASGTGNIYIPDSVQIDNNLTVNGTTDINSNVSITDNPLTITGDITQTGNYSISGNADIDQNITVGASVQFEEILINDNVITTTTSNADLDLRAAGTGTVNLQETVNVTNNLSARDTSATNTTVNLNITTDNANIGNVEINDNYIETTSLNGDLNLVADRNVIITGTDTLLQQDLTVQGDTTLQGTTITGNVTHVGNTNQTGNVTLLGEWTNNNIYIEDNFITTTESNSNLELRANGTGEILIPNNNVQINNNLTVSTDTSLQGTTITGTITHTGDRIQVGNYTQGGELTVDNLYFEDNFITTTSGDLTLEAPLGQIVSIPVNDVQINNDLTVSTDTDLQNTTITGSLTHTGNRVQIGNYTQGGELTVDNLYFEDNFITTTTNNLILGATGDVNVDINNVELAQDLTVSGLTNLQNTTITGTVTHTGDTNQTGNYSIAGELTVDDVYIEDNFITTLGVNQNLELRASGTGTIYIPNNNVQTDNDLTVSNDTDLQDTTITGTLTQVGDRNITPGDYVPVGYIIVTGVASWAIDISTNLNTITYDGSVVGTFTGNDQTRTFGSDTYNRGTIADISGNIHTYTIEKVGDLKLVDAAQYTQTGNLDVTGQVDFHGDVQFTDVNISDNVITTTVGNNDLDLRAAGTGQVLIDGTNLRVNNNLFTASITTTDINIAQDLVLDEINITDSNIEINDNYISTATSNSNLELRATGDVTVPSNDVTLEQDLTVNGNTDIDNATITGDLSLTGSRTQIGNYNLIGNLNISSLVTDQAFQFDDVKIHGNVLETTLSNSNLDLRAAGTGEILINDSLHVYNNLTTGSFNVNEITVDDEVSLEIIELSTDVQFEDNVITTTNSNSNLELRANGTGSVYLQNLEFTGNTIDTTATDDSSLPDITLAPTESVSITSTTSLLLPRGTDAERSGNNGDIRFNTTSNLFEGTLGSGVVSFNGVYSTDRQTSLLAHPTNDTINFTANNVYTGTVDADGLSINALQVDDIRFNGNTITTNVTNSNLELERDGTGEVVLNNISIVGNSIKNNTNKGVVQIKGTGYGTVKFNSVNGIVIPFGGTATQPDPNTNPIPVGDTRFNTDTMILETWDGNQYLTSMGPNPPITPQEFDDLLLEYTIIFG